MAPYFFRVEHELLRSEAFKTLGGSAIKVYLIIGLYSDFGTDWAFPSIRTIARQAGLSRQTVLSAIDELTRCGLLATSKSKGRSTAYKILRPAPERPSGKKQRTPGKPGKGTPQPSPPATVPIFLEEGGETGPIFFEGAPESGPDSLEALAQFLGPGGPEDRPERDPITREDTHTIPIPGTPFRLTAEGRLLVAVDLQELLTNQGIPPHVSERLTARKDPEVVAKVLLNALYLQSQGKLQNGPGYIRAGIEDGYDLLPQVAHRLESRRRELAARLRTIEVRQDQRRQEEERAAEEAAINLVINRLRAEELESLVRQAVALLPEPIVRRNPTLSNPFVRGKVYELAGGGPLS